MILQTLATFWIALAHAHAETGLLYATDFDSFPVGPNQWTGTDNWFGNPGGATLGIQGIDDDLIIGLGKSAYLGFNTPATRWNYVARSFNHDPAVEDSATIEIDTLIGIQDSTNGFFDSFFVSLYNQQGQFLAAVQFTNEKQLYRIWRDDGLTLTDTTVNFIPGELQLLVLSIDFQKNRWSAEHDGIPLFTDQIFSRSGEPRTFGSLSYEWQVTDDDPAHHGNNWMLVADCQAWAIPAGAAEVLIDDIIFSESGRPAFQFTGEPGWTYQIEYTETFSEWHQDLPDSNFVVKEPETKIQFTDSESRIPKTRFYRIQRTVTP